MSTTKKPRTKYQREYKRAYRQKYPDLDRQWRTENPEKVKASSKKWIDEHWDEHYRSTLLHQAIVSGQVKKPGLCEHCGLAHKLDAHHPERNNPNPLKVIWLCRSCHKKLHAEQGGK